MCKVRLSTQTWSATLTWRFLRGSAPGELIRQFRLWTLTVSPHCSAHALSALLTPIPGLQAGLTGCTCVWNPRLVPPKDRQPLWAGCGERGLWGVTLASSSRGSVVTHKAQGLWYPMPEPGYPMCGPHAGGGEWGEAGYTHMGVLSCPGVLLFSCLQCLMVAVLRLYP